VNMRQFYREFERAMKKLALNRESNYFLRFFDRNGLDYCPITAVYAHTQGIRKRVSEAIYAGEILLNMRSDTVMRIIRAADNEPSTMSPAEKRCRKALIRRIKLAGRWHTIPCLAEESLP
jgi:hypothetical protein